MRNQLVLRLLNVFHVFFVCSFVYLCIYPCHVCNTTSHTLLPCDFTLVDLMAAWSTGVATMSSLGQLQF